MLPYFHPNEVRVLGCLIEKRFSTPDSYPLTMNSLINACNQSSNRDPVVHYDQHIVDAALKSTRAQGYSLIQTSAESRVPKFKENLCEKLGLDRYRAAILAELMLRGPQTPGELRQRTTRMAQFEDLAGVEEALTAMAEREFPLVLQLPRQPGKREARYCHLLSGEVSTEAPESDGEMVDPAFGVDLLTRVANLEAQMRELVERLERLEG